MLAPGEEGEQEEAVVVAAPEWDVIMAATGSPAAVDPGTCRLTIYIWGGVRNLQY